MMPILYCIPSLGVGGAERQIVYLSDFLPRYGWELHLAVFTGGAFESRLAPSARLYRIGSRGNYDPLNVVRIARLMRRIRPAIVQTHLPQMDVVGGVAALLCRVPWVLAERSSALAHPPGWKSWLRERLGHRANGIMANSEGGLDYWRGRAGARALQRVIPNAISAQPLRRQTNAGRPLVAFVGRLSPEKRIQPLLQAVARVRTELPFDLILCGSGPLADELRAEAATLGIDDIVRFAGFVDDVPAVLRRADTFVSLSRFEGLPNAVQEAVICGTPLILSDIPAHRELIANDCALFVDGDDPSAVADALLRTLRDRDAAQRRAEAALRLAERWSPAAVAAAYDRFYRELLEVR